MKILIAFLFASACFGACHAITPSGAGSKNGTSWSNAYAGIPTTLTRGDTYYLADGSYGSYTFNTTGSTSITIKKATASDYGNGCSIGTGWNDSTMGSASANFTQWAEGSSSGGNYTLTGVFGGFTGNTELPTYGSFGICIAGNENCTGGTPSCASGTLARCVGLDGGENENFQNVTFSYIEIMGMGATSSANTNTPDDLVYYGGSSGLTLDHLFLHDSSCDFTSGYGSTNLTVQYSFFYKNWGTGSCHGQVSWNGSTHSGAVWRYNTMRTIEGSAIWTAATAGGGTTYAGVQIYGNTIYWGGASDKANYQCLGDGVFACLNSGVSCNGLQFYNNTIVDLQQAGVQACGAGAAGIYYDPASSGGSATVRNNLWYGTVSTSAGPSFSGGTITEDHNSALGTVAGGLSGTNDVNSSGASNPFVTWSGSGNLNAELSADGSNVNNWYTLSSPFNVDPLGVTRTTDRGAYQYSSGGSQVNAPTNLSGVVLSNGAAIQ